MEIWELGLKRRPIEACGILLSTPHKGRWLVEMPNRADDAQHSYMFTVSDLKIGLFDIETDFDKLTVFHTHPGGNIGPSRVDIRAKISAFRYLVVALTDEGPIPTWY